MGGACVSVALLAAFTAANVLYLQFHTSAVAEPAPELPASVAAVAVAAGSGPPPPPPPPLLSPSPPPPPPPIPQPGSRHSKAAVPAPRERRAPQPSSSAAESSTCPPVFQAPDCTRMSASFKRTAPPFASAYTDAVALSAGSLEKHPHKRTLVTCLPPDWHAAIPLGPVTPAVLRALPQDDAPFSRALGACAVVGSSGHLLEFELGAEIDAHDAVFRFNSAPTKGFEKHVGQKTTHRITNGRNFAYRERPEEHVFIHLRNANTFKRFLKRRQQKPNERLYGIHTQFHRYMDKTFKYLSTSGLNGIVMALHKCRHIDLYGFHVHARQSPAVYHYYNPEDKPANAARDGDEWFVVKALAEAGHVTFREACVLECHEGDAECAACSGHSGAA